MYLPKAESALRNHLLIEKDQNRSAVVHVRVSENFEHLVASFLNAPLIGRVDDEDERIGVRIVVTPERSEFVLPSNVPVKSGMSAACAERSARGGR